MSRLLAICLFVSSFATPAFTQSGPMSARVVFAKPPPALGSSQHDIGKRVVVELDIDVAGNVTNTRVVEPSGSRDFDAKVQKYYSRWRFLPALDQDGTPIASQVKMAAGRTAGPAPVDKPEDTRVYEAASRNMRDETSRIMRMRCKDFLWEHDFMRDIAGTRAALTNEQMIKTSMAIFMVQENVTGEELKKLDRDYSHTIGEVAKTCRDRPEDKYYEQVLAPALKSQLGR